MANKKKIIKRAASTKSKPVATRKRTRTAKVSKSTTLSRSKRAVQKTAKRRTVGRNVKKTLKKRYKGRAQIVRRKNKAGRTYYFNKKTKKFSNKSKWYKYRTYAIKHKPKEAAPKKPSKEKEKLTIDLESALIKIDLDKANESELREEVNRLILEQARWRDRLGNLKLKKNKDKVHKQLARYARAINKIKAILGDYQKPRGFDKESYNIGESRVDNIYRWEVKKFLDTLFESENFEIYLVQGVSFMAEHEIDIHLAVDDLIIDAEMSDIYYLKFSRNSANKTVHITLNY